MTTHDTASAVDGGIPPQLDFGLPCPAATDSQRYSHNAKGATHVAM